MKAPECKKRMDTPLNFLERIQQYIFKNLLSVLWTASLLVGGFIFWLYFSRIQYFPDLDFDESVLYLVVAAITGIFSLFIAILLMTPFFSRWWMLLEQQKISPPSEKEKASDNERIWYFFSLFLVFYAYIFYLDLEYKYKITWLSCIVPLLIAFVIILGHIQVYSPYDWIKLLPPWIKKKVFPKYVEKNDKQEPKEINMFGPWIVSLLFLAFIKILFLDPLIEKMAPTDHSDQVILSIVFLSTLVLVYLVAGHFLERLKRPWWYVAPLALICLSLIILPFSSIPKFVMGKYKFGNFETHRLLVNKEGCAILENLELIPRPAKDQKTCYLKNIKILSRLGRSFYIETTRQCKPPWLCVPLRFTIPSEHVLSWSISVPDKRNKAGTKEDSNP